jgi:hypothetical protein
LHQAAARRRLNFKRSSLTNAAACAGQANTGGSPIREVADPSTHYESPDSGHEKMLTDTETPAEQRIAERTRDCP